jgi:hypothetical protein
VRHWESTSGGRRGSFALPCLFFTSLFGFTSTRGWQGISTERIAAWIRVWPLADPDYASCQPATVLAVQGRALERSVAWWEPRQALGGESLDAIRSQCHCTRTEDASQTSQPCRGS